MRSLFFLSDPCAPTRIPRTEQNDPHFNYILYSGPASPIWRLFSKLSRRGCRGHGACGGKKGARSLWMPSVCVFLPGPCGPTRIPGTGSTHPLFYFCTFVPALAMSTFPLVLRQSPPAHPGAMYPSRKNVGTSPMIAVPAVGWLTPISLYLFSLLLISLFRGLDDVFHL